MEEMSPAVAVTLSLSTSICDSPAISNHMEITRLKFVTDTASLLSDPASLLHAESSTSWDGNSNGMKVDAGRVSLLKPGENSGKCGLLQTLLEAENGLIVSDSIIQGNEDDEMLSVGVDPIGINGVELLPLGATSELSLPIAVEIEGIDNGQIVAKVISLEERSFERKVSNLSNIAVIPNDEIATGPTLKASVVALPLPSEKEPVKESVKSVFELECVPLWGSVSICGKRPEMEDAIMVVPNFMKIPIKMFIGDRVIDGLSRSLTHLTSHFYGVYDGHGGSQVADYCRKRVHLALVEELKLFKDDYRADGSLRDTRQVQWEKVFTSCFLKVDDEVGGKVNRDLCEDNADASEPIAPETVGSTAVVAVICSSHIVVANCGDSRAVLYRGKEAMALSIDHKPSREDEYARIEASGGNGLLEIRLTTQCLEAAKQAGFKANISTAMAPLMQPNSTPNTTVPPPASHFPSTGSCAAQMTVDQLAANLLDKRKLADVQGPQNVVVGTNMQMKYRLPVKKRNVQMEPTSNTPTEVSLPIADTTNAGTVMQIVVTERTPHASGTDGSHPKTSSSDAASIPMPETSDAGTVMQTEIKDQTPQASATDDSHPKPTTSDAVFRVLFQPILVPDAPSSLTRQRLLICKFTSCHGGLVYSETLMSSSLSCISRYA